MLGVQPAERRRLSYTPWPGTVCMLEAQPAEHWATQLCASGTLLQKNYGEIIRELVQRGAGVINFVKAAWEAMHTPLSYTACAVHDDAV